MVLNPYLEIRFSDVEIDMIFDIFGPYLPQKSVLYLSPMIFGSLWQTLFDFFKNRALSISLKIEKFPGNSKKFPVDFSQKRIGILLFRYPKIWKIYNFVG